MYESTSAINKSMIDELDLSEGEYAAWFKKHRRKKKALSVFDSMKTRDNKWKYLWVIQRQKVINYLVKSGIKGEPK